MRSWAKKCCSKRWIDFFLLQVLLLISAPALLPDEDACVSCSCSQCLARPSHAMQVMYAYSANRKAVQPCRITLSGLGKVMRAQISKLTGFETWLGVTPEPRCFTEIFDKGGKESEDWKDWKN